MGVVRRYYLVIRDKETNDYNIINICDRFGHTNRINKLEVIDDLTMHYKDSNEFIDDLFEQGYITDTNVDVFIVSPNRSGTYLDYYELVYNSNKRDEKLKDIIDATINGDMSKEEESIKHILDRFADLMYYNDEFNNIVTFKYSNVNRKYVDYFRGKKGLKPYYSAKYKDGEWALNYYPLIRNIVDIMDRFDKYKSVSREVFEENLDYYSDITPGRKMIKKYLLEDIDDKYFTENSEQRLKLKNELLLKTNKNYLNGQISFDDYLNSLDNEMKETQMDIETKLTVVMEVFKNLPKKAFSVLEDGTTIFNTNMFLYYDNSDDKNKLSELISNDLFKDLDNYVVNSNRLKLYSSRIYDVDSLSKEVNHYETKIYNRLVNNLDELNDCYSWCLLYNKCIEDDMEYRKKLGEDNGKVYDKYGEYKQENN